MFLKRRKTQQGPNFPYDFCSYDGDGMSLEALYDIEDDPRAFHNVGILRAELYITQPVAGHASRSAIFAQSGSSDNDTRQNFNAIPGTGQAGKLEITSYALRKFFCEQLGCTPEVWRDVKNHVFDTALSEFNQTGNAELCLSSFCIFCKKATPEALALCLEWYTDQLMKRSDAPADCVSFDKDPEEHTGVLTARIDLLKHRQTVSRRLLLAGSQCSACVLFSHGYNDCHMNNQGHPVIPNNRTERIFRLARRWLRNCLNNHEGCRRHEIEAPGFIPKDPGESSSHASSSRAKLPKRLIRIDSFLDKVKSIRLVYSSDLGRISAGYLALSHCWGGARIVQLTTSNLEVYLQDIPFSSLPPTFSDAIRITSLLGYDYLWIDSLCILQDSKDDWIEQAAQMGSVYRNSAMTIAALGAKNSQDGCYLDREFKVPNLDRASPLHSRAWAVQERCLSTRTLNFGVNEISWDCIEWKASESHPMMVPTNAEESLKRRFHDILNFATDGWRWRYHWIRDWWEFVQVYTACDLTFATDRWPAFQGLSTEIQRERKKTLLHGLWLHRLVDELMWSVTRQEQYRLNVDAPSWTDLSTINSIKSRG